MTDQFRSGGNPVTPMDTAVQSSDIETRVASLIKHMDVPVRDLQSAELDDAWKHLKNAVRDQPPAIVVVGELSVGKSSMINALIGHDVMKVASDVATAAYVTFTGGKGTRVLAHMSEEVIEEIGLDEVSAYSDVSDSPTAAWVQVELEDPRLDGVVLIDTPGAGGLDAEYGKTILAALRDASTLMFLSQATRDLTNSELDFLKAASQQIDRVLFVMTMSENADCKARERGDRALLAESAPRFRDSTFIAISSDLERSAQLARGSESLLKEPGDSGFPQLWREIQLVRTHHSLIHEANRVRTARGLLGIAQEVCLARTVSVDPPPELLDAFERERDELIRWQKNSSGWEYELRKRIQDLRGAIAKRVTRDCRTLLSDFDTSQRMNKGTKDQTAAVAGLGPAIISMSTDLEEQLRLQVQKLCGELAEYLPKRDAVLTELMNVTHRELDLPAIDGENIELHEQFSTLDKMTFATSGYLGFNMTHMALTALPIVSSLVTGNPIPIILAIGGGVFWSHKMKQAKKADMRRAGVHSWVAEQLEDVRDNISTQLSEKLDGVYQYLSEEMSTTVQVALSAATENVTKCRNSLNLDEGERRKMRHSMAERRLIIGALMVEADKLLKDLESAISDGDEVSSTEV